MQSHRRGARTQSRAHNHMLGTLGAVMVAAVVLVGCIQQPAPLPTATPEPEAPQEPVDILVGSCYTNNVLRFDGETGEYLGEFVPAGSGGMNCPEGEMLVDEDGYLYVTSFSYPPLRAPLESVVPLPAALALTESISGTGVVTSTGMHNDHGTPVFERTPSAVTYNDQVLRFDAKTGEFIDVYLPPDAALNGPHGMAFTKEGNLFVATRFSSNLLIYDGESRDVQQVVVENGEYMLAEGITPGLSFRDTNTIALGPDGGVYVSSYETGDVFAFDEETGVLLDRFVSGEDDGHPMQHPHNVLFGPDGNLYVTNVTEEAHHSVLRFDGDTGEYMDVFVDGQEPWIGYPSDIMFMPDGNLVLVDCAAGAVLRYDGVTGEFMNMLVPPGTGLPPGATSIVAIPK